MFLLAHLITHAQHPDFTNITAPYVQAFTGRTEYGTPNNPYGVESNPFATQGVARGRHTVITTQGTDPHTGNVLQFLPPGENKVIRLGNDINGAQAEALQYRFTVDKNNPILLVKFAVVMEDPQHGSLVQPRFTIRITDTDGNLLEDCAEYDVYARPDIPGFRSYQDKWCSIRWRDWTNIGLDMSRFVGHEVLVQFITYDCSLGGHFGYAYFTAHCIPNKLHFENCGGGLEFTLAAPEDFASYKWSNGETSRTATFKTAAANNTNITCTVTSATGCQFLLYAFVTSNPNSAVKPGDFTDVICEGETYTKHNFNLPPQEPGEHFYQNVIVNPATCKDSDEINLTLNVVQRYNYFREAICHGEDYAANGFTVTQPPVGVYRDTIKTRTINTCDIYDVLKLTVNANFNMPTIIKGETSPCTNEIFTYTFSGIESLTEFEWIIPDNAVFYKSYKYAQTIQLYFTDATPTVLELRGQNGCGAGIASLLVKPKQSYNIQLNEEICAGGNFNTYNFNLGTQDSVGYFVHSKHLISSQGCDSIITLALSVLPTPIVRISPANAMICNQGDEISLLAIVNDTEMPQESTTALASNEAYVSIYDCSLNYLWNNGSTEGAITVKPLISTEYSVEVTTQNGCSAQAQQAVVVRTNSPQTLHEHICSGETYTKYGLSATQSGIYPVSIHNGNCTTTFNIDLTVNKPAVTHVYDRVCAGSVYAEFGLDAIFVEPGAFKDTLRHRNTQGCTDITALELTILPQEHTLLYDSICQNEVYDKHGFTLGTQDVPGKFTHTRIAATPDGCKHSYLLQLIVYPAHNTIISHEIAQHTAYNKYNFNFTRVTKDTTASVHFNSASGCDSTVVLNLRVAKSNSPTLDCELIIPNVFTPNDDGVNDVYLHDMANCLKTIIIINRWGQTLYEGVDGWNGIIHGKPASPGTYYYIVTAKNGDVYKGALTLIRE
jgi:gliding motility-associated-like protein